MTEQHAADTALVRAYDLLTGDEDARVCRDIPEAACNEQPGNFFKHLVSFSFTKIGDSLASAKLVLPWLLSAIGAPAFLVGFLVPIRHAGALLPQLFVAGYIRPKEIRKWFWVGGSVVQGSAVLLMALVAATLGGSAGGWAIVALLVVFSLARGVSSVSSKDVLGKTVSKTRRGTMMGYATAFSGIAAVAIGVYAKFAKSEPRAEEFFFFMLLAAGLLWLLAAAVFGTLKEAPGATEGGRNAFEEAIGSLRLLKTDRIFRDFVITRALLLSTALSIPFYVILGQEQSGGGLAGFGLLFVADGIGGSLSAPFWGRLADRSSRLVMVAAALMTTLLGFVLFASTLVGFDILGDQWRFAIFFLLMGIAYGGARLGRKTYLVDMAPADKRPSYVALSNTAIGVLLLVGSGFGAIAQLFGTEYVILLLAAVALVASIYGLRLPEVED